MDCRFWFNLFPQHWTPTIPFLAPLLDGMITRNVSARFTAADALAFLEDQYAELDDEQRHRMEPKVNWETYDSNYETHDRWTGLPPDLVRKWSHLREPKLPWTTKTLRWLCEYQWAQKTVRSLRRLTAYLSRYTQFFCLSVPCRISRPTFLRHNFSSYKYWYIYM